MNNNTSNNSPDSSKHAHANGSKISIGSKDTTTAIINNSGNENFWKGVAAGGVGGLALGVGLCQWMSIKKVSEQETKNKEDISGTLFENVQNLEAKLRKFKQ